MTENHGKKIRRRLALFLAVLLLPIQPQGSMQLLAYTAGGRPGATSNIRAGATTGTPLPSYYNRDVTNLSYVTAVEDQGTTDQELTTDACWAYMSNAVLESYLLKTRGKTENLSERAMISQLYNGTDDGYSFTDIETGGNFHRALAYWTRGTKYGPVVQNTGADVDIYVTSTIELGSYDVDNAAEKADYLTDMKNLIRDYGAVGVSLYFDRNTQGNTVSGGAYYYSETGTVNHGVAVVGWDDNYAGANFKTPISTPGAFLVKNSWGNSLYSINQNSGYYWVSYENYFKDAFAITGVTDGRKNMYDYLYETDYRGLADYRGSNSTNNLAYSNTYTATSAQMLTSIGTYVQAGTTYSFTVNDQAVTLAESGTMTTTGFHVFRLATPVSLAAGNFTIHANTSGGLGDIVPVGAKADGKNDDTVVCLKAYAFDNLTPSVPSISVARGGTTLDNDSWVMAQELTFTASGSTLGGSGSIVYEYMVDNSQTWNAIAGQTFTYTPSGSGTHTITVRAKNSQFPTYCSAGRDFIIHVDTTKPVIGSLTTKERTTESGQEITVSGIADTESGVSGYYCSETNEVPTLSSAWTKLSASQFSFYSVKNTTYYLWVRDAAGNISDVSTIAVTAEPTVTEVTVSHEGQQAYRGSVTKLTATVTGTNHPAQTVIWKVSGTTDPDTAISSTGDLTIGCLEYAQTLTVTATSTVDSQKSATTYVSPTSQIGTVTSVIVAPQITTIAKGSSQKFTASVYGSSNLAPLVTWQVSGNSSNSTLMVGDTLYVGANETAETLTLTATSKLNSTVEGRSTIMVREYGASGQTYTVKFYDNGLLQSSQTVLYGRTAVAPALYREGYTLSWDKSFTNVTSNLEVHAIWTSIVSGGTSTGGSTGKSGSSTIGGTGTGQTTVWTTDTQTADTTSGTNVNGGDNSSEVSGVSRVATVNKGIYTIRTDGTAHFKKNSASGKKRTTVNVPAKVEVGSSSYPVTAIGTSAFRRNTKLTSVTIGKNLTKIGVSAFYSCKKLKKIKIKSENLTTIGDDAFQNISSKAVIYVPRSCLSKYRRMIRNSGNTTAKVKAYN